VGLPGRFKTQIQPGGGFVLASTHHIMPYAPPANIKAMFAAVAAHGA